VVRWLNDMLIRYGYGITASHNDKNEKRGLLNYITPVFFHLKSFFRSLKSRMNRKLYYTCKYALLALVLWGLVHLTIGRP
jgi:hypothetical protein